MLEIVDKAVLDLYRGFLNRIDNRFTQNNVFASLVDDDKSNRLLYENKRKKTENQVSLPFAVLVRNPVSEADNRLHSAANYATEISLTDTETGLSVNSTATDIDVNYKLQIFCAKFADISRIEEKWFLRAGAEVSGGETPVVTFGPEGFTLPLNIVIGQMEQARPIKDDQRENGLIYKIEFPLTVRTLIFDDDAVVIQKIIKKIVLDFYIDTDPPIDYPPKADTTVEQIVVEPSA